MTLTTGVGETRTIRLPDGSIISAGADTDLVATLLKGSRTVVLGNGEAYFRVVKNPGRPFTVRAGDTTVTDIGTAFDVRRTLNGVIVAVAEGVVDVATHPPRDHIGPIEGLAGSKERPSVMTIQLTAGEHHLAKCAVEVIAIDVDVRKVIVGANLLNLAQRILQRVPIPEPDVL